MSPKKSAAIGVAVASLLVAGGWLEAGRPVAAAAPPAVPSEVMVAAIKAAPRRLRQQLTLSSELVPFQQIDVYAKESGYVKQLRVDYGSQVKAGQVIATLEIPELAMKLQEDGATIAARADQVAHAKDKLARVEAQQEVAHLEYERLNTAAKSMPGLLAQQEVDDARGKDLAAAAQVASGKANVSAAESDLAEAQANRQRDQVLFDYSKITAPFSGVVTKRYANLGTLVQAGTSSSTQVLPIVRLSQDDLFRLVIPVPESYVRYIRVGDPVKVFIPSLGQTWPGRIARFAGDVSEQTRTMHTEVDVPNPDGKLMPGLYADATLTLARAGAQLSVPLQAVHREGDQSSVDVVNSAGQIAIRPVRLGIQTANWAAIESGLKPGELVVTSDAGALTSGEKVQPEIGTPLQYRPSNNPQSSAQTEG